MKFYTYSFSIILLFCFGLSLESAAQTTLSGSVLDSETNEPLIGANILVKGTSEGNITDFDGNFELSTSATFPMTLVVSYTGYASQDVAVSSASDKLNIKLGTDALTMDVVEVRGRRISEKQQQAALTVETLDNIAIKETASDNFYDGLGSLKGVDLTAASLGFKVINMRGFNSTSPVRSLQIIDGLDNQAPGLNFSLGNFLGSSELDVNRVELVVGASSAFYGPNAFNGVISMETKDPFYHKGLSAMVKGGERNLLETAIRWGDAVKNKNDLPWMAYKLNFSYLRADDWEARNYDPVDDSDVPANNPGRYDAVNIYGDEYQRGNDDSSSAPWTRPGLNNWYRTGYKEEDLVDYDTRNMKASAAMHFRLKPERAEESSELILSTSYGAGTTVYQGDNRFSLKGITFLQNRVEFRKKGQFFVRAYNTRTSAGDSYDPYFTALELLERAKEDRTWTQNYTSYWISDIVSQINEGGYPQLEFVNGEISFDREAARQWLIDHNGDLTRWHAEAEAAANAQSSGNSSVDFFEPGTARFEEEFNDIAGKLRTEGGTKFSDNSSLTHIHGEYIFRPSWADKLTVGTTARMYMPESEGTVFYDTAGITITNLEFGMYGGIEKSFLEDRLKAQVSLRVDKNENFDWLASPAASLVWNPNPKDYFRVSFSSAIRNPTLSDQYLFLDVGRAILGGNLNGVKGLVTLESLQDYFKQPGTGILEFFNIDPVRPEQVQSIEAGYRTTLFGNTYLDASYYFSIYNDFLGFNFGLDVALEEGTDLLAEPLDIQAYRYAANSINTVTTQGFSIGLNHYFANNFVLNGNYSWNTLVKGAEDDPIIPAFNTPEHKFNIGISGRDVDVNLFGMKVRNMGFNLTYKWIEGFLFEGSPQFTGFIPTYDLVNAQINFRFKKINTTMKLGASNLLDNRSFQTYGGPRIGRLAYISFVYSQDKR